MEDISIKKKCTSCDRVSKVPIWKIICGCGGILNGQV